MQTIDMSLVKLYSPFEGVGLSLVADSLPLCLLTHGVGLESTININTLEINTWLERIGSTVVTGQAELGTVFKHALYQGFQSIGLEPNVILSLCLPLQAQGTGLIDESWQSEDWLDGFGQVVTIGQATLKPVLYPKIYIPLQGIGLEPTADCALLCLDAEGRGTNGHTERLDTESLGYLAAAMEQGGIGLIGAELALLGCCEPEPFCIAAKGVGITQVSSQSLAEGLHYVAAQSITYSRGTAQPELVLLDCCSEFVPVRKAGYVESCGVVTFEPIIYGLSVFEYGDISLEVCGCTGIVPVWKSPERFKSVAHSRGVVQLKRVTPMHWWSGAGVSVGQSWAKPFGVQWYQASNQIGSYAQVSLRSLTWDYGQGRALSYVLGQSSAYQLYESNTTGITQAKAEAAWHKVAWLEAGNDTAVEAQVLSVGGDALTMVLPMYGSRSYQAIQKVKVKPDQAVILVAPTECEPLNITSVEAEACEWSYTSSSIVLSQFPRNSLIPIRVQKADSRWVTFKYLFQD